MTTSDLHPEQQERCTITCTTEPKYRVNKSRNGEFNHQYNELYSSRLQEQRPKVVEKCKKWANKYPTASHVEKMVHISLNQICFIIGTVYVDMPLKPSVLDEITREQWVEAPPPRPKYASDQDIINLEDESGRVCLSGAVLKDHILLTGMVVGVLGSESANGSFEVLDVCYPALKPQPSIPIGEETWIAIVSGLEFDSTGAYDLKMQMLLDYLLGELGTANSQNQVSKVSKVIIAGNSISIADTSANQTMKNKFGSTVKIYDQTPIQTLDNWLSSLCSGVQVSLMPGETDPASYLLPQQPIPSGLFSNASHYSSFETVTNPFGAQLNDTIILGNSGQIIDSLFKYVETTNRMDIIKQTLRSAHLAPSCPDTLSCHPFTDTDPFCLDSLPHLYFVGNQPEFESTKFDSEEGSVTIISVPKFKETGTFCLVNLSSLEVKPITFNCSV